MDVRTPRNFLMSNERKHLSLLALERTKVKRLIIGYFIHVFPLNNNEAGEHTWGGSVSMQGQHEGSYRAAAFSSILS